MPTVSCTQPIDDDIGDRIEDMIRDLEQDCFEQAHAPLYENIENDSKMPLYSGCTTFTRLSTMLALVNLKARFGWSDKNFHKVVNDVSFGELERKICVSAPPVVYHDTKCSMTNLVMMQAKTIVFQQRSIGIFQ